MRSFCKVGGKGNLKFKLVFSLPLFGELGGGGGEWRQPIEVAYIHPGLSKFSAGSETEIRKRTDYSGNSCQFQVDAVLP